MLNARILYLSLNFQFQAVDRKWEREREREREREKWKEVKVILHIDIKQTKERNLTNGYEWIVIAIAIAMVKWWEWWNEACEKSVVVVIIIINENVKDRRREFDK